MQFVNQKVNGFGGVSSRELHCFFIKDDRHDWIGHDVYNRGRCVDVSHHSLRQCQQPRRRHRWHRNLWQLKPQPPRQRHLSARAAAPRAHMPNTCGHAARAAWLCEARTGHSLRPAATSEGHRRPTPPFARRALWHRRRRRTGITTTYAATLPMAVPSIAGQHGRARYTPTRPHCGRQLVLTCVRPSPRPQPPHT